MKLINTNQVCSACWNQCLTAVAISSCEDREFNVQPIYTGLFSCRHVKSHSPVETINDGGYQKTEFSARNKDLKPVSTMGYEMYRLHNTIQYGCVRNDLIRGKFSELWAYEQKKHARIGFLKKENNYRNRNYHKTEFSAQNKNLRPASPMGFRCTDYLQYGCMRNDLVK